MAIGKFSVRENWWRKEIERISTTLYDLDNRNKEIRYFNLKMYRDELLRGYIIFLHLAIEGLLKDLIVKRVKANGIFKISKLRKSIDEDVSSKDIIIWAGRLKLIRKKEYMLLLELNRIRNKCAHKWIINSHTYKNSKNRRIRTPLLMYRNKNLMNKKIFLDSFGATYSSLYLKLFYRNLNYST